MGSKKKKKLDSLTSLWFVLKKIIYITRISCVRTAACFKNAPKIYLLFKMPLFITFHS